MSDSIKTKVRKSLVYNIQQITKAHGYLSNINEVNAEPRSEELIRNRPACNFLWGRESYQEAAHSSGRLHKESNIILDFHLLNNNKIDTERNKIISDVEKLILNNRSLKDVTNAPTCKIVQMVNNNPWGLESNKALGGVTVEVKVEYQQNVFDPYTDIQGTPPELTASEVSTVSFHETLTQSILWNLAQIKTSTGYNKTMYADRDIQSYEQIKNYPFANIISRAEEYVTQGQDRWVRKKLQYTIDVFIRNSNSTNADIEAVTADIEKRLYNNYSLVNQYGYRTCTECYINSLTPFNLETTKPAGGLQMILNVYYRQDLEDPNQPQAAEELVYKSGQVNTIGFTGSPQRAAVSFVTPFSDVNYAVDLTPLVGGVLSGGYAPIVYNKTVSGFNISINANTLTGLTGIMWVATPYSNS